MSKLTTRDRIWSAALTMAEEKRGRSTWGRRFKAMDVAAAMDDPPSSRTVRETLQSMVELGHLEKGSSKGEYEPLEREDSSSTKDQKESSGPSLEESSASSTWSGATTSTSSSSEDESDDEEVEEAPQETPDVDVDELDLPGGGSTLEARRTAVRACYDYLREEGQATKQDFIDDVRPDHPARYGSAGGWWNTIGKKGLRELARTRDDVEAPTEGGHIWEYTG